MQKANGTKREREIASFLFPIFLDDILCGLSPYTVENATAVRSELMQGEIKAVFPKLDRMDLRFVSCRGRAFGLIIAIVSGPPGRPTTDGNCSRNRSGLW